MVRALLLLAFASACGRLRFDERHDGGVDDATVADTSIDVVLGTGVWNTPVELGLNIAAVIRR